MFKIIGINTIDTSKNISILSALDVLEDPFVVDVRNNLTDEKLKDILFRDYLHLVELRRGIKTYFHVEGRGKTLLKRVIERAKRFEREVVILHEEEEHFSKIVELVKEED